MVAGKAQDPDPYLMIWSGCRRSVIHARTRWSSAGGWLDQDLYTSLVLEVIDLLYREETAAREAFERKPVALPRNVWQGGQVHTG